MDPINSWNGCPRIQNRVWNGAMPVALMPLPAAIVIAETQQTFQPAKTVVVWDRITVMDARMGFVGQKAILSQVQISVDYERLHMPV